MQVDFYQLSRDPVEKVVPLLASKVRGTGGRLLVVSQDDAQLALISRALWEDRPHEFLANGKGGDKHSARQPILLSHVCEAENGARFVLFADGVWRDEGLGFDRAFLMFGQDTIDDARACWRGLDAREGVDRRYWAFEDGGWLQKA